MKQEDRGCPYSQKIPDQFHLHVTVNPQRETQGRQHRLRQEASCPITLRSWSPVLWAPLRACTAEGSEVLGGLR